MVDKNEANCRQILKTRAAKDWPPPARKARGPLPSRKKQVRLATEFSRAIHEGDLASLAGASLRRHSRSTPTEADASAAGL